MSSLAEVKENLSKLVSRETYKDIEDFLSPHFNANRSSDEEKRHWRIVRDGHGRWREIKPQIDTKEEKDRRRSRSGSKRTRFTPNSKLLFSNNILNCVKNSSKVPSPVKTPSPVPRPCSSLAFPRQDYSYLSTATRSNIFPGVGNYDWHSQSNAVHTESALNLGECRGHDLREEFYGITKDAMGAWSEASVHHERMKKSWDVYLESLAKEGNGR